MRTYDKYHAKWKAHVAKCSKYHAKCKVTMPKCSKYHAKQVLVPNCCKYKANGTGKERQKKPKPEGNKFQKLFYTHLKALHLFMVFRSQTAMGFGCSHVPGAAGSDAENIGRIVQGSMGWVNPSPGSDGARIVAGMAGTGSRSSNLWLSNEGFFEDPQIHFLICMCSMWENNGLRGNRVNQF